MHPTRCRRVRGCLLRRRYVDNVLGPGRDQELFYTDPVVRGAYKAWVSAAGLPACSARRCRSRQGCGQRLRRRGCHLSCESDPGGAPVALQVRKLATRVNTVNG